MPNGSRISNFYCPIDIHKLMLIYMESGQISNPNLVGLESIDKETLEQSGFEMVKGALTKYSSQRYFKRGDRVVECDLKFYFDSSGCIASGVELSRGVRLSTALKVIRETPELSRRKFDVFLCENMADGAILFDNDVVMRFGIKRGDKNYFVLGIDGQVLRASKDGRNNVNSISVGSIFKKTAIEMLEVMSRKSVPLKKVVRFIR
ncbi:hypothetical protein [Burkholderia sp. BE17]|uniref:hypothetical protein n=1 Tax=Burkholderia sp. BE17 TaxID=2656644 RepID=UPI001406D5DC|nr:hypothetical protein [Burkholderia sp. BE17]MPV71596.1 hypothetical protein [Burkholderia sp. BE17]